MQNDSGYRDFFDECLVGERDIQRNIRKMAGALEAMSADISRDLYEDFVKANHALARLDQRMEEELTPKTKGPTEAEKALEYLLNDFEGRLVAALNRFDIREGELRQKAARVRAGFKSPRIEPGSLPF